MRPWTFFTNHGLVLTLIAHYPQSTAREIASVLGITERTARSAIADLVNAEYVTVRKRGRVNSYRVLLDRAVDPRGREAARVTELVDLLRWDWLEPRTSQEKALKVLASGEPYTTRDVASQAELTLRTTQRVLNGLSRTGVLALRKSGRMYSYRITSGAPRPNGFGEGLDRLLYSLQLQDFSSRRSRVVAR